MARIVRRPCGGEPPLASLDRVIGNGNWTADPSGVSPATDKEVSYMPYASVSSRFVAVLVDLIVFFVLGFVLALLGGTTETTAANGQVSAGAHLFGGNFLLLVAVALAYHVVMEATLGASV